MCNMPRKHNVAVRSLRRPKHARRSDKIDGVDGESLKISRDRPVFIVNHSAEEKLCALYKPWNVHSLLTTGPLVVFQCKRSVRSTRTRATRKRRHGLMQWGIICLHPAVFKRYGPPLALQNMLLARLLPLFKSKARFFRDHSIEPLRGCAVFSFRLFLSSSEKKREEVWFDYSGRTSAWPGEPSVSLLPLYVQCAIRPCTVWSSTLCDTTADLLTFTAFSGPPSRGRPLCWCSSKSPLNLS